MTSEFGNSAIYKRMGTAFAAMAITALLAACGGGSSSPPATTSPAAVITAQPTDQSAVVGSTATFTVAATNATGYQWQRSSNNGASFNDVANATVASHTTAVTTAADNGARYRVLVSGAGGSVTSSAASLQVTAAATAPSISMQPTNQTIAAGQNASFSVTTAGTALLYQWQRSTDGGIAFANEAGATAATLDMTGVAQARSGNLLRVVVSNTLGSVTSTAALLTVNAQAGNAPVFTTQPVSVSIVEGQNTQFSVAVTGTPAPTLEWQVSVNNGAWFGFGTTTPVYAVNGATVADNGRQYRVVAINSAGTTVSNVATLTVNAAASAPVFTTQPVNVAITSGQNTQFTVVASGSPTPNLQWQLSTNGGVNFSNITGATNAVFEVLNAGQANNGRQFRAVATNSAGTVNSNAATLTVNAAPAGGRIVFTRGFGIQASPSDILLVREDGTGEIALAATADDERFLGMTPGGRVVFSRVTSGGVSINSVNPDGTGAVLLVSTASPSDFPVFHGITPDGWVIYRRDTATTGRDLYAVKADGTGIGPVALANAVGNEDFATITASGKILYQVEAGPQQTDLYSINADGTGRVALAAAPDFREGWSGYQSAGQIVIVKCLLSFSICDYISVNENGGVATLLARDTFEGQYGVVGVTKTGRFILRGINVPNFQPGSQQDLYIDNTSTPLANSSDTEIYRGSTADGRVIYNRLVPVPNTSNFRNDLYIVNADGSNTIRLAIDAALVAVAPDGRIVYATLLNNDPIALSTVKADGTGAVELGSLANTVPFFQAMTANGRVVFSRETGSVSGLSLRAVNTDGTGETLLAVRSYFVANTPSGKVVMRDNDNGNTNISIVNPDGTGLIRVAATGNNEFFNFALP